jgi:hypothetical protein
MGRKHLTVLLMLLALQGCATSQYWEHTSQNFRPSLISIQYMDDVSAVCPPNSLGCALRVSESQVCHVFIKNQGGSPRENCVLRHEIGRHCTGWDHPKFNNPSAYTRVAQSAFDSGPELDCGG